MTEKKIWMKWTTWGFVLLLAANMIILGLHLWTAAQAEEENYRDFEYKLFYGEWEVTSIVGSDLVYPLQPEQVEHYLADRIKFSMDDIYYNGSLQIESPKYGVSIIPIRNPDNQYIGMMPTLREIGIAGEYFVFIALKNYNDFSSFLGNEFYIKDDNTLVAFYDDTYFELKRVSHEKDYDVGETHIKNTTKKGICLKK